MLNRRAFLAGAALLAAATPALTSAPALAADDWRKAYPKLTMGVVTSENEADRIVRYKPVVAYLENVLGVPVEFRNATDYAGVIEALNAGKLQVAGLGPAAYAQAWIVSGGKVEPLAGQIANDGTFGYHSVVVVKADSPYQRIEDLRGKKFAFADPNSTSGFQAPSFFLKEAGIDPESFFGTTAFSGSHENSVIALLNDTFDAAATWWNSEERSNFSRMWDKGMIPKGSVRVIWKSPLLPSSPVTVRSDLPAALKQLVAKAYLEMPTADPAAWKALTDGKMKAYRAVSHAEYEPIVRMIKDNQRARRGS